MILAYDPQMPEPNQPQPADSGAGSAEIMYAVAPTDCTVVAVAVSVGDTVVEGATVAVVEMMKIEHLVAAPASGVVESVSAEAGDVVSKGHNIASIRARAVVDRFSSVKSFPSRETRSDLSELLRRRRLLDDDARPDAITGIHARGRRSARENLDDLVDPGSFQEYGRFMFAAQTGRRDVDDLMANTPGDGIIGGLATINGDLFEDAKCAVMSYDYTVMAGTQGFRGHEKKDRLLEIVDRIACPVVLFAEGGGGRPGDTDQPWLAGLHLMSFSWMSRLSGLVPSVAIVSGYCFAGNAALAAVCDLIIATPDANLGMAGPAMIEGGGLGVHAPSDIGPVNVQTANGVIDIVANDEAHAVAVAKKYLGYFQGDLHEWDTHLQTEMRTIVPENRKRSYDVRRAIELLSDVDSTMELRPSFGRSVVTVLGRLEGRPVGVLANDPRHLGGAIDADSADKAARFAQLCDAFGLPLISLCDTPGFMVGPEAERTAQVRHFGRMFVVGASLTIPTVAVVLRKAVGLGAMAMVGGSFHANLLSVAWPTGEFSGMGIEGAVTLGARRQLEAIADPAERSALWKQLVAEMYNKSSALNAAVHGEIDDVIDPAETRDRLAALLGSIDRRAKSASPARPMIDTW